MKQLFLLAMVLWLSACSLLAQNEQDSSSRIAIRGGGFFPGETKPLFVIDGLVYDSTQLATDGTNKNPLAHLNPDDIVAINVLKNESATDLYGDKAKYGAIIITTKKGKAKTDKIQKE